MRGRPLGRAAAWLAFLGPFFFLSYNWANAYASRLPHVPNLAFEWERHVPFLAWTIITYWSSDVLYAGAFALCRTRAEVDRLGWRLLAIQVFSVACFVLFPLRVAFARPVGMSGAPAWLFEALLRFDLPFNQAPSLHVSLAVILWAHYCRRGLLPRWCGAWFALMALSSWTTYQHQFIDLATGAWAGVLTLAAIPERRWAESQRPGLALAYLAGAAALTAAAFAVRGYAWLLLWPACALSLVAAGYWTGDVRWLGQARRGWTPVWMWPYTAAAWVNAWLWTKGQAPWQELEDGVWVGRAPRGRSGEAGCFRSVVAVAAELPAPGATAWIPILDLTLPRVDQIEAAVEAMERAERPVLICCALGYSRSAILAAAWWMARRPAGVSAGEALDAVRRVRPWVVVGEAARARLEQWWENRRRC
jgi:protein-tyrosine phosphatase